MVLYNEIPQAESEEWKSPPSPFLYNHCTIARVLLGYHGAVSFQHLSPSRGLHCNFSVNAVLTPAHHLTC